MTRERALFDLPDYKGPLRPAPWCYVTLTEELKKSLKATALKECPVCDGEGYLRHETNAYPCRCLKTMGPQAPPLMK